MFWTALIYKTANPQTLRKKLNISFQSGLYNKNPFPRLEPFAQSLKSGSTLPFNVLWDNGSGHPEPHEFSSKGIKVVYLSPNTKSLFQPLDQEVTGPLRLIRQGTHQTLKGLSMIWKRTPMERAPWKSGRITPLRIP